MRPALRAALLTATAFLVPACTEPLDILGPAPVDQGIIIYIHSEFRGTSQVLAADVSNLGRVEGPCAKEDEETVTLTWDDCVSSIKVMPGWGVTLYRDRESARVCRRAHSERGCRPWDDPASTHRNCVNARFA